MLCRCLNKDLSEPEISVGIGASLVAKSRKGLAFARVAVLLGALVFSASYIYSEDYIAAIIQFVFSVSLMGLIFGSPGFLRSRISISLICCYFLLQTFGTVAHLSGYNALAKVLGPSIQNLDRIEQLHVEGFELPYTFRLPNNNWMKKNDEVLKEQNPEAAHWFTNPAYDGHVIFIEEVVAESLTIEFDAFVEAVTANARNVSADFREIGSSGIQERNGMKFKQLSAEAKVHNMDIKYHYGLFADAHSALQVTCFAQAGSYDRVLNDFRDIVQSVKFEIETDVDSIVQ